MSDQSRSPLTAFVSGELNPSTLYLGLVNIAIKEKGRFGAREIVDVSREKITERPECMPADLRLVADMCMNIATTMYNGGHDDHAIIGAEEAERLYRRIGDQAAIARSVDQKMLIQARLGGPPDLAAALGSSGPGGPAGARPSNRLDELAIEINGMLSREEFERAMEPVAEYAELARESGDRRAMLASLDFQSKIVSASGDGARAAELIAEQQALLKEIEDPALAAKVALNNGLNLIETGQLERAREVLEQSLQTSREHGYAAVEGSALWALGGIACDVDKNLTAAHDLFKASVEAFQRDKNAPGMVKSMAYQAQVLTQLGRVAEAWPMIERAHKLALNLQLHREIEVIVGPIMSYIGPEAQRAGIIAVGAPAPGQPPAASGPGGSSSGAAAYEQARNAWAADQYAYMKAIAEWKSLPFLKRRKTPKPQPPKL